MTFLTGGPGAQPLGPDDRAAALTSAKAILRVSAAADEPLLGALLDTATAVAEQFLGQVLIARTIVEQVAARRCWTTLGTGPVRAIPMAPTDDIAIDIDSHATGWLRVVNGPDRLLTMTYQAGLATDWAALPSAITQGVALLAAHLFSATDPASPPPAAVTALWRPFRAVPLAEARHAR